MRTPACCAKRSWTCSSTRSKPRDLGADVRTWTGLTEPVPFVVAYQRDFQCLVAGGPGSCSLTTDHELSAAINQSYTNTISSAQGSSWPFTVDFANPGTGAFALLPPGVSEEPTSVRYDDQIPASEQKGSGDIAGIGQAPLDLSAITVTDERELTYTPQPAAADVRCLHDASALHHLARLCAVDGRRLWHSGRVEPARRSSR